MRKRAVSELTGRSALGATLQLSPNGTSGTLIPHQQAPIANSRYDFDSANKPQEIAFSGVWDMPFGKGQHLFSGATGIADKIASGWRISYTVSYISGSPVSLPQSINFCGQFTNYVDPTTGALLSAEQCSLVQ